MEREELLKTLRHDLDAAIAVRNDVSKEFDEVTRKNPRGSGDQERMRDVSRRYTDAQEAVTRALMRLNDFLGVKAGTAKQQAD